MTQKIGFILLTHTKPHQVHRLASRLNAMFDEPPIVCHHDFSKSSLPLDAFSRNVSFVLPHLQTGWAQFSVVEALVRALEQMYLGSVAPDWCVVLSGADYPIKPPAQILQDLDAGSYDAHIGFELIKAQTLENDWQRICYNRYCTKSFEIPFPNRKLKPTKKRILTLKHPLLTKPFLPFSKFFHCFAGSQWFCVNSKATKYIIEFHRTKPKLAAHYGGLMFSEESYIQTILANEPNLKLNNYNWRYIDWTEGKANPNTLLISDLPKILASRAHFARKFDVDVDPIILDELDAVIA